MRQQTQVDELLRMVQADNGGESDPIAETMAAALIVGPNQRRLAKVLPYTWTETFQRCRQIREAGIFRGAKIDATDGWDDGVAFWLDVLVVQGLLRRHGYGTDPHTWRHR